MRSLPLHAKRIICLYLWERMIFIIRTSKPWFWVTNKMKRNNNFNFNYEARREIVTPLKYHSAAMKPSEIQLCSLDSLRINASNPSMQTEQKRNTGKKRLTHVTCMKKYFNFAKIAMCFIQLMCLMPTIYIETSVYNFAQCHACWKAFHVERHLS